MTQDNWRPVAALIDNLWKDEFDEAREAAYFHALHGYAADEVQGAVLALAGQPGGAWAPSASQIAAEIHAQRYIGTWEWVKEVLRVMINAYFREDADFAYALCNRRLRQVPAPLVDEIAAVHPVYGPLVTELVSEVGLMQLWHCSGDRWSSRKQQVAWAKLVTGTTDPVAAAAALDAGEGPSAIRPVH